jgi:uncharacterized membrane protein YphA (DoxX/SURF4 family)
MTPTTALLRIAFGLLMALGGVMHFTIPVDAWHSPFFLVLARLYLWQLVGVINFVAGTLLITNRFTTLALVLLAPIAFTILGYHLTHPGEGGVVIGLVVAGLELMLLIAHRKQFAIGGSRRLEIDA